MRRFLVAVLALCGSFAAPTAEAATINSGSGQYVWTDLVGTFSATQATSTPGAVSVLMSGVDPLSDIAGFSAGDQLLITMLGIAGDSRATSGDNRFRLTSSGTTADFTWVAGQQSTAADYRLAPTPEPGALGFPSTGFTYQSVSYLLAPGEGFNVFWDYHHDYDGRYAGATDILGNAFDDSAFPSSIRAWVQFEIVEAAAVPVPAALPLLLAGLGGLGLATRRRRRT
ncbi:VPLPA-CTERM sorting domain-containing protein [Pacificoceanicola onchidii]|uniref:VPLPA-CTERM sorting domain-containing protein n=1 Tax=Pacificoceanicola onchidii TaxID=2562685 RepID=UPI00197CF29D|nr:VPLPA-CTERM sorting domain-containing protein [Pacificoceanicola onchidii]